MPEVLLGWAAVGVGWAFLVYLFSPRRLRGGGFTALVLSLVGSGIGGYFYANSQQTDILHGQLTWGMLVISSASALIVLLVMLSGGYPRREKFDNPLGETAAKPRHKSKTKSKKIAGKKPTG